MTASGGARRNPFPGLRPFEDDQEELFFGREAHIDDLLSRLRRRRFVAVVGTSGSGKSSLVRAGLIPRLHGGSMAGVGSRWWTVVMRPGSAPLATLATALDEAGLLGADDDDALRLAFARATLERGARGLVECIQDSARRPGDNVLVVVDQFEELFRFAQPGGAEHRVGEAAAFARLLVNAARDPDVPVYVLITMRSEFLGDAARFRNLPETINDGLYLVPRLTRDQLRQAIEGPIGVVHAEMTPRLVNQLLNDVGDDPDQLPILQHALMRTWDIWIGGGRPDAPIDLRDYRETGGLADALSKHGREIYDELGADRKVVCERLFEALVDPRGGVRAPLSVRTAIEVTQASPSELIAVADAFRADGRSFLMPPAGTPLDPDQTLDIAHESLMRNWDLLVGWLDHERQAAQVYARLVYLATEVWPNAVPDPRYRPVRAGRADPTLLHGTELAVAERWRVDNRPNAAWARKYSPDGAFETVIRYLDCSLIGRRVEAEHRVRTDRIVRGVFGTIIGAAAALLIFGAIAVRSSPPAMLLLAFAIVGLASAAGGVALGRRIPLAAGIGAVSFGSVVYAYAIATCIGFVSHNLTPALAGDATFKQWIALLPGRARAPVEAGALAALRDEYGRVVSVDAYPWRDSDFSYANALIAFLEDYQGSANGNVLFFRAQIDSVVHKPESAAWRLDHTSIFDPWSTYLRNVPAGGDANELRRCWTTEGLCRERAGWILYVLAYTNWHAYLDPKPHDLRGRPLAVSAAQRLRYLEAARDDLAKSVAAYPPCAWVYEPPPAEMMQQIQSELAVLHAPPPLRPIPPIRCAEPRHDPFVDYVAAS